MELLKKVKSVGEQGDSALPSSYPDEEKNEAMGTSDSPEEAIFEDLDKEKDKIREWWLQSEVEEVAKEELKAEELKEEERKKEEAQKEEPKLEEPKLEESKELERRAELEAERFVEGDAFISSLREDLRDEEEEEMNIGLREAMEELGNVSAEELLEFGRVTLRELTERMKRG